MSTASPLPLQPLPPDTLSEAEARALKQEVASKLAEHRQRRGRLANAQEALPLEGMPAPRNRIASSVAARFSKRVSYRDFLQHEAEVAIHQAEAEAEVARRTADAIVAAQQQLLDEIDQWNSHAPAEVITMTVAEQPVADEPAVAEALPPVAVHAVLSTVAMTAVPMVEAAPAPLQPAVTVAESITPQQTVAERLLSQLPLEPAVGLPTNLIEFPRQLVAARRARPRLAEGPLRDEADAAPERAQLRIFEVEASSVSTTPLIETGLPEWHSIRLDAAQNIAPQEHADPEISFAIPLYVAPRSARAMATLVDGCCVTTALLVAIAAAIYVSPEVPTGLPALMACGAALFVFWLFYQALFFTLSDATPGMRYARIGLCTFGDENPTRASMRRRIGARLLAGMPIGLGLLWACLDEEGLGWHDRISRMYPRAY